MTTPSLIFDETLRSLLEALASEGVQNAAQGLSEMVGEKLTFSQPMVSLVPFTDIPMLLGGPENEAVGIYLRSEGQMAAQMMLVLPYPKALELVDLLMGTPVGSTQHLGQLERSALAEVGNLVGSFFLNAVALITGQESRPSPPAVMVDMIGAILDIIIAASGEVGEHVPMIQTSFLRQGREVEANFWVVPDRTTLNAFARRTRRGQQRGGQ
jgi:chemotaxis protein CheC